MYNPRQMNDYFVLKFQTIELLSTCQKYQYPYVYNIFNISKYSLILNIFTHCERKIFLGIFGNSKRSKAGIRDYHFQMERNCKSPYLISHKIMPKIEH